MSDNQPYWVVPNVRVPIGSRLRFAADVANAVRAVKHGLPRMAQRRAFRMAMERQTRRRLKLWRENVR